MSEPRVTSDVVVLLTEEALGADDAARLAALHGPDLPRYRVLVPADTERNLLVDVLDHLSLLELREAVESVRGHGDASQARVAAGDALARTVARLQGVGAQADGQVTDDDPLPAVRTAVQETSAREVVVVTRPHTIEDTVHADWASRARQEVGVPVLHLYAGSGRIG